MGRSRTNKTSLVFPAKVTSLSPAVMTNVQLLFGPMLIGVFLNMILYGVLIVQTYSYYQEYKSDSLWIKFLVYYLFIIETANTAFDMLVMYEPLILHYGLPEATANFPRFFAAEPFVIVAVSTPIQIFFAWRIHKLTKSSWVAVLVVLLAFVSLAGGIWTGTEIVILKLFSKKPLLHTPALVWFLSSCVADVLITLVLVYSLSKRKTGFSATDDAIAKIIRTTVQTGMLTAIFAVGDVVFFMTLPHTALNFLWDLALSKLYANCLLSTLNARRALKEKVVSSNNHRISTAPRRQLDTFESSHVMSPSYELEHQKHFDHTSTYHRDVEFGITVTKVVETIEDPHPHGRNPTQ